ncbi:37S ribosomal protein S35, mitochondrial [[Candida] anglica]
MYTCGQGNGVVRGATVTVQQVRQLSRRKYKYPQAYTPVLDPKTHPKKDHRSWFRRHMIAWLGPTNIRGEYYKNKYYYPPQDHQPRYIVQDGHTDGTVQQPEENGKFFSRRNTRNVFQPFPENPHCKTALMISNELKDQMHKEVTVKGLHSQQVAHKYGIKIARVEAISKLEQIKAQWKEQGKITPELERFGSVMYKMFPLYEPPVNAENLTEIPTPSKTLHQRFLTISESEPFGPVDAAKLFDLEPAQQTLDNLTEIKVDGEGSKKVVNKVLVAPQNDGDRHLFKFTHSTSGEVGNRYGASRRDTKKDRRIGFDASGKMVYM